MWMGQTYYPYDIMCYFFFKVTVKFPFFLFPFVLLLHIVQLWHMVNSWLSVNGLAVLQIIHMHWELTHYLAEQLLTHLSSPTHNGIPREAFPFYQPAHVALRVCASSKITQPDGDSSLRLCGQKKWKRRKITDIFPSPLFSSWKWASFLLHKTVLFVWGIAFPYQQT